MEGGKQSKKKRSQKIEQTRQPMHRGRRPRARPAPAPLPWPSLDSIPLSRALYCRVALVALFPTNNKLPRLADSRRRISGQHGPVGRSGYLLLVCKQLQTPNSPFPNVGWRVRHRSPVPHTPIRGWRRPLSPYYQPGSNDISITVIQISSR